MNNLPIYEWEYKKLEWPTRRFIEEANILGKQGWELISFYYSNSGLVGIFKRPKVFGFSIDDEKL